MVGDNVTDFTKPKFTGTAEPGATVTISSNGVAVGSGIATGGNYSITLATALADGGRSITAQATDPAGNAGATSAALSVTIDTQSAAPSAPVLDASVDSGVLADNRTKYTLPTFDGTGEDGATVTIYSKGTAVGSGVVAAGVYHVTITTPLAPDGVYAITARATDVAGNTSAVSAPLSLTIDTTPPAAPSVPVLDPSTDSGVRGDSVTRFTNPKCTGTAEAGATVTILGNGVAVGSGVATGGNYAVTITTALVPDGVYGITAQATDAAGNTGAVSAPLSLTIDTTPPTVQTPASAAPGTVTGTTTNLSVLGADNHGESNLTYSWAATMLPSGAAPPVFSASGTNAAKNTVATFRGAGWYTLTATITDADGLTAASSVDVWVGQTFKTIAVSPASASVLGGQTLQFTATADDQFGAALATQPTIAWATTAGTISAGGLLTAPTSAVSQGTVTAAIATISGTATFVVPPNQPPTVAMAANATPGTVTGTSTNLSVLGADDGGEANLTYTWALVKTLPSGLPARPSAPTARTPRRAARSR